MPYLALQFEPTTQFDEKLLLFAIGTFIFVVIGIVLIEISYRARQKRLEKDKKKRD
jgi:sensor domain CHASE-containing protein